MLILLCFDASARRAQTGIHTFVQPDGTTFLGTINGDEFCHYVETMQGSVVLQGDDGFYNYAFFTSDGFIHNSGVHFGIGAPSDVVSASMNVPYEAMRANALAAREEAPVEEMNLIQRMQMRRTKADVPVKHGMVILANYTDVKFRYRNEDFDDLLKQPGYSANGATGSAKEYFDAQFNGMFEFDFDVFGPVELPQNRKYYGANDASGSDLRAAEMIYDACRAADDMVDFSVYDDDGDGVVDNVFVFFAGGDEAEGAGEDLIWAHAWYISAAGLSLTLDGTSIDRYACASELITFNAGKTFFMSPIGTFCHEYSHTFGLPDFYDTDYSGSGGLSDALWYSLSLMDAGNQNNDGNTPPYFNAVERYLLGMGECMDLPGGKCTLEAVHRGNKFYKLDCDVDKEFYLIECREKTGWDSYIGGQGMLVYHVDQSRNSAGRSDTYGTISATRRWVVNEVNAYPKHQCVDLVEANPYASAQTSAVTQVFFPYGNYNSLVPGGKTPIRYWSGVEAAISITGITYADGHVSFNVSGSGEGSAPPAVVNVVSDIFQDAAIISFEADGPFEGNAKVAWGETGKPVANVEVAPYADGRYALVLEGLKSSTAYKATVCFENNGLSGDAKVVNFMTGTASASAYPYINVKNVARREDGSFERGALIPLRVNNPGPNVDGILWYYNGAPIKVGKDGYWHLAGNGLLKAEIIYKDGSKNVVGKQMIVR